MYIHEGIAKAVAVITTHADFVEASLNTKFCTCIGHIIYYYYYYIGGLPLPSTICSL